MTHYVICPFSKPEYRDNLAEALNRQTFRDFVPVVVENGQAIGAFPGVDKAVILRSSAHQSTAKNVALRWIRDQGDASWSVFDCDDYYGPEFLRVQLEGLKDADLAGQRFNNMLYVSYDDGLYINSLGAQDLSRGVMGGTISCKTAHVPDFPVVVRGEDSHWSSDMMVQRKARIAHTGPRYYCYNRGGSGHTWALKGSEEENLKRHMRYLGKLPLETVNLPPRQVLAHGSNVISQVVMLYTPNYLPAQVSIPDVRRYCHVWEYPFTVHTDRINIEISATWNKVLACLQALETVPEGEWVLWMDADILLRRYNQPLECLIDPEKDFMISTDSRGICAGMFIIRNTPLMKAFFTELLQDIQPEAWEQEQGAMKDLLAQRPDYAERVGHIPETLVSNPSSGRSPGALLNHYWGGHQPSEKLIPQMKRDIWCRDTGRSRGRMFSI